MPYRLFPHRISHFQRNFCHGDSFPLHPSPVVPTQTDMDADRYGSSRSGKYWHLPIESPNLRVILATSLFSLPPVARPPIPNPHVCGATGLRDRQILICATSVPHVQRNTGHVHFCDPHPPVARRHSLKQHVRGSLRIHTGR